MAAKWHPLAIAARTRLQNPIGASPRWRTEKGKKLVVLPSFFCVPIDTILVPNVNQLESQASPAEIAEDTTSKESAERVVSAPARPEAAFKFRLVAIGESHCGPALLRAGHEKARAASSSARRKGGRRSGGEAAPQTPGH